MASKKRTKLRIPIQPKRCKNSNDWIGDCTEIVWKGHRKKGEGSNAYPKQPCPIQALSDDAQNCKDNTGCNAPLRVAFVKFYNDYKESEKGYCILYMHATIASTLLF